MTTLPFPLFSDSVLNRVGTPGRWEELHLYHGARCNRACAFCCVEGSPDGGHTPFTAEALQAAVEIVAPRGSLKFYGGEPTLDTPNLQWAIRHLRELGFEGAITIFSNGIRAKALTSLLDCDPHAHCYAVLNYSIATGRGERPLPPASLRHLQCYAQAHPNRLYLSHDFVIPVGRQAEKSAYAEVGEAPTRCFHCYPVLTSQGQFHACPFAVEYRLPHYHLGTVASPPAEVQAQFARFQEWITLTLEPQAALQGENACHLCIHAPKVPNLRRGLRA